MAANPFLLAADNSPALLPLLRENPALASQQDGHGYSLVHAAASYNHLDLLRTLIREFNVDVNLRDEDEETALFVVETVEAARVLVEELGADIAIKGSDGHTARQKINEEGEFPEIAEYLSTKEVAGAQNHLLNGTNGDPVAQNGSVTPSLPEGLYLLMCHLISQRKYSPGVSGSLRTVQSVPSSAIPRVNEVALSENQDFNGTPWITSAKFTAMSIIGVARNGIAG